MLYNTDMKLPESLEILRSACHEIEGCEFEVVDKNSGFLARVQINGRAFYPSAAKIPIFPINSSNAAELVNDKSYTNYILKSAGLSVTDGEAFLVKGDHKKFGMAGIDDALLYAERVGYPVFAKPNRSSHGRLADICYTENDLREHVQEIARVDYVACVQRLYNKREFRVFCLNGKVVFGYERIKPTISGNGKSSIRDLISSINEKTDFDTQRIDLLSKKLANELAEKSLTLDDILTANQTIEVSAAANIARGGEISNITFDGWSDQINEAVQFISNDIGLNVFGIDYFAEDISGSDFCIIEVNHNPSLKGISSVDKSLAISIWVQILRKWSSSL